MVDQVLQRFGSMARIRSASIEELSRVVARPLAARIAEHCRNGA